MTTFKSFGLPSLSRNLLNTLASQSPLLSQEKAIPAGLEGHDILGSAQTGRVKPWPTLSLNCKFNED